MARTIKAQLLAKKLDVKPQIVVNTRHRREIPETAPLLKRWSSYVLVGTPRRGETDWHRVLVGGRFVEQELLQKGHCRYDGEAMFKMCPECHVTIDGPRVSVIKDNEIDGFETTREVGRHEVIPFVNPLTRGSLVLVPTDQGERVRINEERQHQHNEKDKTIVLMYIEGSETDIRVICRDAEDQKKSEMIIGNHWSGASRLGTERLLCMGEGDKILVRRALRSGREEEFTLVVKNQWIRLGAKPKVLKDPTRVEMPAQTDEPVADPEVERTVEKAEAEVTEPTPSEIESRLPSDESPEPDEPTPSEIESRLPGAPDPDSKPAAVEAIEPKKADARSRLYTQPDEPKE